MQQVEPCDVLRAQQCDRERIRLLKDRDDASVKPSARPSMQPLLRPSTVSESNRMSYSSWIISVALSISSSEFW